MRQVGPESGSVVYYLHGDRPSTGSGQALGSTSLATDASGGFLSRVLYYPYGETRWTDGTLPTDYQFTGQRNETSFGLYDYHARYYDPAIGRFVSADTIVPQPGNPQDFNRYAYVRNNPVGHTDPSGHAIPNEEGIGSGRNDCPLCEPPSPEKVVETLVFMGEATAGVVFLPLLVEDAIGLGYFHLTQLSASCLTNPICGAIVYGVSQEAMDGDDTEAQLARTAYEIGEEGEDLVFEYLKDPTLQREVRVYVNEAGRRANYVARLDGVTETAVHEVKNVANLSLSQRFMNQATTYKRITDGLGVELHYWLVNSAPERVVEWLQDLGAIVHTGVPGQ